LPNSYNKHVFEALHTIKRCISKTTSIDEIDIANKDLSLIYHYMQIHNYTFLELKERYSLNEVKQMIEDPLLLDNLSSLIRKTETTLFKSSTGLVNYAIGLLLSDWKSITRLKLTYEDLYQEGKLALFKAIRGFNPERYIEFSTYAIAAIKNNVLTLISKHKKENRFSLDVPVGDESRLVDFIPQRISEESIDTESLKQDIRNILSILTHREREIILKHYGLFGNKKQTFEEIGKNMNLTRERIRQIEKKAIKRLRINPKGIRLRREYMD
jgi:RNA polymerase sigma factor (sigma-70 family)